MKSECDSCVSCYAIVIKILKNYTFVSYSATMKKRKMCLDPAKDWVISLKEQ